MQKQRWYLNDGNINPNIDTAKLRADLRALFGAWVLSNNHPRDFVEAVQHTGSFAIISQALEGNLDMMNYVPESVSIEMPADKRQEGLPKKRFYDDEDSLTSGIDLDDMTTVLTNHCAYWVYQNCLLNDFTQAIRDIAAGIHYDFGNEVALGHPDTYLTSSFNQSN